MAGRDERDPFDLVEQAAERLQEDAAFRGYWDGLDGLHRDETLMDAAKTLELFRSTMPPLRLLRRELAPSTEWHVRAELLGGALVLSGQLDLVLGGSVAAEPVRATRLAIDLKTGRAWPEHAEDMRFYALLLGAPLRRARRTGWPRCTWTRGSGRPRTSTGGSSSARPIGWSRRSAPPRSSTRAGAPSSGRVRTAPGALARRRVRPAPPCGHPSDARVLLGWRADPDRRTWEQPWARTCTRSASSRRSARCPSGCTRSSCAPNATASRRTRSVDEVIDVPEIGPHEALVMVMAAGVNFNNVWAARGVPVDVTKTQARWGEPTEFHIVGSDASGVVYAVGDEVTNVQVGDHVVVHAGQWDLDDPWVVAGNDPGLAASFRVWGYDTCWGSFAQFTKVQAHQCLPKAERLTWEEAAAPTLTGSTAYRMLHGWPPNTVKEGDVVLVWGASGGLGSLAVQLVTLAGAKAVAVVSSAERGEYAKELGAVGWIDRTNFDHWGVPPAWNDPEWRSWFEGAKAFGKAIWDVLGERRNPNIVFDHPGQDTIPTSIFVCERGGMVVICAGTSGYDTMVDVRYLWYLQKRYQGSHLFNDEQAAAFNDLVRDGEGHDDARAHVRLRGRRRPRTS